MYQFWRMIWGMCLLRTGPQDIPASQTLLLITVAAYFGVSFVLAIVTLGFSASLGAATVDVVFLLIVSYVILWIKLTTNRWYQVATALAGVCTLIGAIAIPFAAMQAVLGTENAAIAFPVLILIGLMVWNLIAIAHVFKHAMDVNMIVAALLAGFYMYLSLKVMNILFFQAE